MQIELHGIGVTGPLLFAINYQVDDFVAVGLVLFRKAFFIVVVFD